MFSLVWYSWNFPQTEAIPEYCFSLVVSYLWKSISAMHGKVKKKEEREKSIFCCVCGALNLCQGNVESTSVIFVSRRRQQQRRQMLHHFLLLLFSSFFLLSLSLVSERAQYVRFRSKNLYRIFSI